MLISLDLETTGFNPGTDQIIEFGAIKFDPKDPSKRETMQFLCNPGYTLPQIVTHITNITDKDLAKEPPFEEKLAEVQEFIGNLPIVGHNIQFDTAFLSSNGVQLNNPEYDTQQLASILLPGLPSYSLEILTKILKLTHEEKHRALDDAIAAMELFLKLTEEFEGLNPDLLGKIQNLSQKSKWPFADYLKTLKPGKTTGEKMQKADPKQEIGTSTTQTAASTTQNTEASTQTTASSSQTATPSPQAPAASQQNSDFEEILAAQSPALFQKIPPYIDLAINLCKHSSDAVITVPRHLFHKIPDELNKIDTAKNYISPERLDEFTKQEFFENHEIIALLKYLIWLPQSKTGHLSEVRLYNEERNTLAKVQNTANSPKIQAPPYICTFEYLIENHDTNSDPKIFLIGLEEFNKSLHHHLSVYINPSPILGALQNLQQIHPNNPTIQSLISKTTIFFGLIGLIYEKYNDKNEYAPRSSITPEICSNKDWLDARQAAQNLTEISQELAEIVSPQTQPQLNIWKEALKAIENIFKAPELDKNLLWIEQNYFEEIVIRKVPYSIAPELNEILKNYVAIDECADAGRLDPKPEIHALPQNRENLEIIIPKNLEEPALPNFLIQALAQEKGLSAVIFNSRKQLEYLTLKLSKTDLPILSQLTGSFGKLQEQLDHYLAKNPDTPLTLLITPQTWEKLENHEQFNTIFLHKLPFEPPSDPFLMALSHNFSDPFNQLQVPRAVNSLIRIINLLKKDQKRDKKAFLLDNRILFKQYGRDFMTALEELGALKVKIFSIDFFEKPI